MWHLPIDMDEGHHRLAQPTLICQDPSGDRTLFLTRHPNGTVLCFAQELVLRLATVYKLVSLRKPRDLERM